MLTAAFWNTNVRDNSEALYESQKLITVQRNATGTTDITATTLATAPNYFTTSATFTADGTTTYLVETRFGLVGTPATAAARIEGTLCDNSGNKIADLIFFPTDSANKQYMHFFSRYEYTPSAGSKTLNVRFFVGVGGTGEVWAYGGSYIKVYGPDIT